MRRFETMRRKQRAVKRYVSRLKRGRLLFMGLIVALVAGGLIAGGMQMGNGLERGEVVSYNDPDNTIAITLECPGWIDVNVETGVFISGETVAEHLVFAGSGSQAVQVGVGSYEVVPQKPQLMLADGSVLEAGEPVVIQFEAAGGESATASIVYEPVDRSALDEGELASLAEISFVDEEAASRALLQAREGAAL